MALTDDFDLGRLALTAGEGRRLELDVRIDAFSFGGERYTAAPEQLPLVLEISRLTGQGYSLRLRFETRLEGPCMRCLERAHPTLAVDAREVDQPGGGEELDSPYVNDETLDVHGWARDALALALPAQIVCRPDCAGLCAVCGANLNEAGPEHHHPSAPDPRLAKLSEIKFG
ncbi:MAG TPA: DUF177 domain-containing protein [Solirubrobacteraceae bacterium]|nr:DUF177 domain-containing protein [Solirubrobacteraceae bacterium]